MESSPLQLNQEAMPAYSLSLSVRDTHTRLLNTEKECIKSLICDDFRCLMYILHDLKADIMTLR